MSLLPPNTSPGERAVDQAVGARLDTLSADILSTLWNADACPEELLPALAWSLHVTDAEGWALIGSADARRQALRGSVALHSKKGTPGAIRRALHAAGFGANSRLTEGRTARRYDGRLYADGDEIYGGQSWAEYQIEVDLGNAAGLDASTADGIAALAREWAPASRHLTRLTWRAETDDAATSSDVARTEARVESTDLRPWRRYFDGSQRYNQGLLCVYDGQVKADGSTRHSGWDASSSAWLAGDSESDTTVAIAWRDTDVQRRLPTYNGATQADGITDHGDAAPTADDTVMPITVTRHLCFDGRHRYTTRNYDGSIRATGLSAYASGITAAGAETTYLEAA